MSGAFVLVSVLGSLVVLSLPASAAQPAMSTSVNCSALPNSSNSSNSSNECPDPPTQPGGLDPFLCYQVNSDQFSPPLVDLTDQFGVHDLVQPLSASSRRAYDNQLCNPVIETPEGRGGPRGPVYAVSNSAAHLYCFTDNTGTAPEVNVTVQNQFGDGNYVVGRSTRLCLPSWKFDPNQDPSNPLAAGSTSPSSWSDPANLNLNHFQCYRIRRSGGNNFGGHPRFVQLQDEFGTYNTFIGPAEELCAPVIKQVVTANGAAVGDPSTVNGDGLDGAHLLCYAVFAGRSRHVMVGNQFSASASSAIPSPVPVHARYGDQLCLASFKTVDPPPETPEVSNAILLPLVGLVFGGGILAVSYRRRRAKATTP
jgi:hypothetical protein